MQTINSSIRSYIYGAFGIMAIFMSIFSFSTTVHADEGDWSASDWSFSEFSGSSDVWNEVSYGGYNGIGESNSTYTSMFDSTNWLVADYGNYSGIGDAGVGCCDIATYATTDTSVWTPVEYGNYTGIGDVGAGCCDVSTYATVDTSVWTPVDYGNYTGIGDAGAGCCDVSTYSVADTSVWTPVDYGNYTGIGDAGTGCCNEIFASNDVTTWTDTNYGNYTGIGDAGTGCCDVATYQPTATTYTPDTVAYTGDYGYTTYNPTTYTYTPVTYTPTTYSTPTYTYTPNTYTYTPTTYSTPTYTYTPTTYSTPTYTYTPVTYTYTPVVYDTADMPSCDSFTASDYFVNDNDTITLTWRTSDTTAVYINKGVGTVALDGTKRVTITDDITYELTASNGQTSVNCSVTINVNDNDDDDTDTRAPHCEFDASDRNIEEGDEIKLSWDNLRTDDIVIRDNHGDTIVNTRSSSRYDADKDSIDIKPTRTTTYTLTAKNGSREDECRLTIDVDEDDDTTTTETPRCELTASDKNIEEGDEVKLSWDNVRTDDIVIRDNHGETIVNTNSSGKYDADKDSITIEPDETTTYTLTAENGSRKDKCTVKITVDEDNDRNSKSSEIPRCVFTTSDTQITSGQKVTLSWKNQRTDSLIIKDNRGREILDSKEDRKINEDKDAIVVQPTQSTTYKLTVKNGSKERDCSVKVTVGEGVSVTSIRSQDGIPLNQVPYTGFDASDMLTMIFYSGIGIWVSIMGYGFWMKRKETLAYSDSLIE